MGFFFFVCFALFCFVFRERWREDGRWQRGVVFAWAGPQGAVWEESVTVTPPVAFIIDFIGSVHPPTNTTTMWPPVTDSTSELFLDKAFKTWISSALPLPHRGREPSSEMLWFTQGLCFLPAFLVIWSSSTFIVSYLIALLRRDVDIIFPYIRWVLFILNTSGGGQEKMVVLWSSTSHKNACLCFSYSDFSKKKTKLELQTNFTFVFHRTKLADTQTCSCT